MTEKSLSQKLAEQISTKWRQALDEEFNRIVTPFERILIKVLPLKLTALLLGYSFCLDSNKWMLHIFKRKKLVKTLYLKF